MSPGRKGPLPPSISSLLRGLRRRYLLALGLVAVLLSIAFFGFLYLIETDERAGEVINLSGHQQVLSQRIALISLELVEGLSPEKEATLKMRLSAVIDLMVKSQEMLLKDNSRLKEFILTLPVLHTLLFASAGDSGGGVVRRVDTFLTTARAYADGIATLNADQRRLRAQALIKQSEDLLPILERVVKRREAQSRQTFTTLENWRIVVFVSTVLVLILEVVFIFRPMDRVLRRNFAMVMRGWERAKRSNKQAREANKAKSHFLINVSHELRTPLNAINGFSEIISQQSHGTLSNPRYQECAHDISRLGRRLLHVIDDILDVAMIESGDLQLSEDLIDFEQVCQSCIAAMRLTAKDKQINLLARNENPSKMVADHMRVKQIVLNLLSNALKFTASGGRVTLTYGQDRQGANFVSVHDTGIGINAQDVVRIKKPFVQLSSDYDHAHEGGGVGLTLVDALCRLHGASLDVKSTLGVGTTVTVVFPFERSILA